MYSNKIKVLAMAALLPFAATSFGVTAQAMNYSITCESGEKATYRIPQPYCVFFEKEADKNKFLEDVNSIVAKSADNGLIAIHVDSPYAKIISDIIERGKDVDTRHVESGWTSLMYSSFIADVLSVNLLIRLGADVNVKDSQGNTALDFAQTALGHIRYFKSVVTPKTIMLYATPSIAPANYVFIANAKDLDSIEKYSVEIIGMLKKAGAKNGKIHLVSHDFSRIYTDDIAAQQSPKK